MIPDEFDYREVLHQEPDDVPGEWMYRSYPIGHTREREWWGRKQENDEESEEIRRKEEARKKLGGFGFRP